MTSSHESHDISSGTAVEKEDSKHLHTWSSRVRNNNTQIDCNMINPKHLVSHVCRVIHIYIMCYPISTVG